MERKILSFVLTLLMMAGLLSMVSDEVAYSVLTDREIMRASRPDLAKKQDATFVLYIVLGIVGLTFVIVGIAQAQTKAKEKERKEEEWKNEQRRQWKKKEKGKRNVSEFADVPEQHSDSPWTCRCGNINDSDVETCKCRRVRDAII